MHHPETSRRKSKSERIHIRREKAFERRVQGVAERKPVLSRSAQIFSREKPVSQQDTFIKLLALNPEARSRALKTMPEVKRGQANDREAVQLLVNLRLSIQNGVLTDLGQVERILDRVGPLNGLFTAFGAGHSNFEMRIPSNDLLRIISNNLPRLTKEAK